MPPIGKASAAQLSMCYRWGNTLIPASSTWKCDEGRKDQLLLRTQVGDERQFFIPFSLENRELGHRSQHLIPWWVTQGRDLCRRNLETQFPPHAARTRGQINAAIDFYI